MRRITFIAPVDAIQGNLSGTQDLRYALNNNKAFESPAGQKNFAKNYQTRYIGARRASDGLKYFAVKTKSCTHTTQTAMIVMALLGGTGAMYAACIKNKASELYTKLVASYENRSPEHANESMRKWFAGIVGRQLYAQGVTIGLSSQLSLNNPWYHGTTSGSLDVPVSTKIKAKFLPQLGVNCIKFMVGKNVITSPNDFTFQQIATDPVTSYGRSWSIIEVGGSNYILYNGYFLVKSGSYAEAEDVPENADVYELTSVAPE